MEIIEDVPYDMVDFSNMEVEQQNMEQNMEQHVEQHVEQHIEQHVEQNSISMEVDQNIGKKVMREGDVYIFECPHCDCLTQVDRGQINCAIFRHGYFINNGVLTEQVNPHLPKEQCDELLKSGKVVGCCGPFQFVRYRDEYVVKKCEYI